MLRHLRLEGKIEREVFPQQRVSAISYWKCSAHIFSSIRQKHFRRMHETTESTKTMRIIFEVKNTSSNEFPFFFNLISLIRIYSNIINWSKFVQFLCIKSKNHFYAISDFFSLQSFCRQIFIPILSIICCLQFVGTLWKFVQEK